MDERLARDKNRGLGSDLEADGVDGENELLVEKKGTGIFSRSIMFSSLCLISLSSSSNWWVRSFCEDKCSQGERWWVESRSFFNCLISADKCWIDSFCWWTSVWSESIFLFSLDSKSKENQSSSMIVFAILFISSEKMFRMAIFIWVDSRWQLRQHQPIRSILLMIQLW